MKPIKALLEATISIDIDVNTPNLTIDGIVAVAFSTKQTPDLAYISVAKQAIKDHLYASQQTLIQKASEKFADVRFKGIENNIEVELEGRLTYGNNPKPDYWGKYKFYVLSEPIYVLQFFSDKSIVYYTESSIEVRFIKLGDGLSCLIDKE